MLYGLFMYGYQGQYVISPSYLGIGKYSLQTAGNVFAMVSAVIAAGLYGNIGIKGMKPTFLVCFSHNSNYFISSRLQQRLRRNFPCATPQHHSRKMGMGIPDPSLLGSRFRPRRR